MRNRLFASRGPVKVSYRQGMDAARARFQTVEDIYDLLLTAIAQKRAVSAHYNKLPRILCPHRAGRNRLGELRVLCYQSGGASGSGLERPGSAENWRCLAVEKLSKVALTDERWQSPANFDGAPGCVVQVDAEAAP